MKNLPTDAGVFAIQNKHGLWYSGDQTYDSTSVFLVYPDYRTIYPSLGEANSEIVRLNKKGVDNLKAVEAWKVIK